MNINRHNYEEYFILYADNELSSDDRRMVEEFISLNPDLKDELDIFLGTILSPDTSFKFDNKEELHHYDESLISYIDNELSYKEELELEKLINGSPKLQQELELYRKTKLQPANDIIFENKSVLYRSTERRRVVTMTIIRWSVAAAILLGISITAVNLLGKRSDGTSTAKSEEPISTKPGNRNTAVNNSVTDKNPVTPHQTEIPKQNITAQTKEKQAANLNKKKASDIIKTQDKQNDNIAAVGNQPPSNNLPTPIDAIKKNDDINSAIAGSIATENKNNVNAGQADVTNVKATPYIYAGGPATTSEPDPNEEGGNKKSRGFFRKLTRVLEKNTGIKATDDDEKLHIAAFTVKLK